MVDGKILLDEGFAKEIGFTSDKFKTGSYLWRDGNYIFISFIWSVEQGRGNLSKLFSQIMLKGYGVKVPTPFGRMLSIVEKKGFRHTIEENEEGQCDVWIKEISKNGINELGVK